MEFHKCDIYNCKEYVAENIDMQIIVIERYKKDENLFYGSGAMCKCGKTCLIKWRLN